jgi:hypothetical protein
MGSDDNKLFLFSPFLPAPPRPLLHIDRDGPSVLVRILDFAHSLQLQTATTRWNDNSMKPRVNILESCFMRDCHELALLTY